MVTFKEFLLEENKPTNPKLWARAKALAKSKFDVWPSAYGSLSLSKCRKVGAANWGKTTSKGKKK